MTEAELLFTDILDCSRAALYLNREAVLDKAKSDFVSGVLKRRIQGEPIQYILGKAEFMGLNFLVNKDVLIPRPETEILVEAAVKIARDSKPAGNSILDIGTGSGCIAVSLAKFLPHARITAIDTSEKAIETARENAILNNVKINFLVSDLFSNSGLINRKFELIISNPPYVAAAEIETLQPEVRYEPRVALDAGKDGLHFYRRIAEEAPRHLTNGGFLAIEMGLNQNNAIKNIFQNSGYFEIIEAVKDYNDIDRVIILKRRVTRG